MKVLILGGTGEARALAQVLAGEPRLTVVSSLAGRTVEARVPVGEVRHGGFGGVEGLVRWLRDNKVDAVVDSTHPFAATMTEHAVAATRTVDIPLLVLRRPGWESGPRDDWRWADSLPAAAALLPGVGTRAFLTIGRQGLDEFAAAGIWMLARCVDAPEPRPSWCEVILDRGPYDLAGELKLLRHHRIDVLVTKDSGGTMTSAKLAAARELGVPVVIVRRPAVPSDVASVEKVDQVVGWLRDRR